MKIRYHLYILILCLLTAAGLAGCHGKNKTAQENTEVSYVELYYLNAEENGFRTVSYMLENSGDPLMASYEVIYQLSDTEKKNTNRYKASIFEEVVVNSIDLNDGEETIDFGAGYKQLNPVREILCRTAIVKSLVQIDGVDTVRFTINGDSLLGTDETPIGPMTKDTFILDGDADGLYNQKKKVTLYYANTDGDGLFACEKKLEAKDNIPLETEALMALMESPESKKAQVPLPKDLKINQTQIRNNVCYVDVSSEIENLVLGVEEKVTVYAMVNTITSLGGASQVQFTVNGKKVHSLNDFDSFHLLMTCDYSLCDNEIK